MKILSRWTACGWILLLLCPLFQACDTGTDPTVPGAGGGHGFSIGQMQILADTTYLDVGSVTPATIQARLTRNGTPAGAGIPVTVGTTLGELSLITGGGAAQQVTAMTDAAGEITVYLFSGSVKGQANLTFSAEKDSYRYHAAAAFYFVVPGDISLYADRYAILADGQDATKLTAVVTDDQGDSAPDGTVVVFVKESGPGKVSSSTAATVDGIATTTFTGQAEVAGTARIYATAMGRKSNTIEIQTTIPEAASIQLTVGSSSLLANGASSTVVTAVVTNSEGDPIFDGKPVTFSTTLGSFPGGASAIVVDTVGGRAITSLMSGTVAGNALLTAEADGLRQSAQVVFTPGPTATITLQADELEIPADGDTKTRITAILEDAFGNTVADGTEVDFTSTMGCFDYDQTTLCDSTTVKETSTGVAYTLLRSSSKPGKARVTALSNGVSAWIEITFLSPGINHIEVLANPGSLPADGASQSKITAYVTDANGNPAPDQSVVTFSATLGTLLSTEAETIDGYATVNFRSGRTSGVAVVVASCEGVTDDVTIDIGDIVQPYSIDLADLSSSTIGVKGSSLAQSTILTFQVRDAASQPVRSGYEIQFVIQSGPGGGEELFPASTITNSSGQVSVSLSSGINSGTVKIVARWAGSPFSVRSIAIAVTIQADSPDGRHLGVWPDLLNIAGLRRVLLDDTVTAAAADRYANPVPDQTSVWFTTDYGMILASNTTVDGETTSTLSSANPLPPDGLVTFEASSQSGLLASVLCLAPDPDDGRTLWVGTDGGGVYKSTDGGTRYLNVGRLENGLTNGIVHDIALNPADPNVAYAATEMGLYRSIGGGTWEDLTGWARVRGSQLGTLNVLPTNQDVQDFTLVPASTGQRARTRVYLDGEPAGNFFYQSQGTLTIFGPNPTERAVTIDYDRGVPFERLYPVRAVAVDASDADPVGESILYAGTYGAGVYKSEDGGLSWFAVNAGLTNQRVTDLAIDPQTSEQGGGEATLYAATDGGGVYASTNSGTTWQLRRWGLTSTDVTCLALNRTPSMGQAALFAGTRTGGVYWSENGGATWRRSTVNVDAGRDTNKHVTSVSIDGSSDPAQATVLYASTREGGVFAGALVPGVSLTWTPLSQVFGDDLGTGTGALNDFTLSFASNQNKLSTTVYLAGDPVPSGAYNFVNASTISFLNPPGEGVRIAADYAREGYVSSFTDAVAVDPADSGTLFAGGNGRSVLKSVDQGLVWALSNGLVPDVVSNNVYTAANALFSGSTTIGALSLSHTDYGGSFAYGPPAAGILEYTGTETFLFTVSDANGNPLVGGSDFEVTSSCSTDTAKLSGDLASAIPDALRGQTDYGFTVQNVNEGDETEICSFTVEVTSEADASGQTGNGNLALTFGSRAFWATLKITPPSTEVEPGKTVAFAASGGSGSYLWMTDPQVTGPNYVWPGSASEGIFSLTVQDTVTGQQVTAVITVKAKE